MKDSNFNRRKFIKYTATTATGIGLFSALPKTVLGSDSPVEDEILANERWIKGNAEPRIKFSVIGINHSHIYSQVEAVIRGGGEFVSFYAKEPDLAQQFAKQFPKAKPVRNEKEILEDNSIQLVLSASIPDERAPLGIRVMQHGKDYLSDKPGITSLEQLAEVRRVQAATKRIYSILYSERHEVRAAVKA